MRAPKKPAGSPSAYPLVAPPAGRTALVRTFLLALLAVAGAGWALVRHYTYQPPALHVPRPPRSAAGASDDAGDLPAPELLETEDGSR